MRLYGGANLALLIGIPIVIILSIILTYSWPLIQTGISKMTNLIVSTGSFGVGLYGFLERILIPTGLHHCYGFLLNYLQLVVVALLMEFI